MYIVTECVGVVFTPQLLRCLHTSLKNPSSHLHAMAKRCVAGMSSALTRQGSSPAARAAIAVALQRSGSSVLQVMHKGSKGATAPLLADLDAGALEHYATQLEEELARVGVAGSAAGGDRMSDIGTASVGDAEQQSGGGSEGAWVVEQLYAITRMQTADEQRTMHVLQVLAANAIAEATSTTVRRRWSLVNHMCW